MNIQASMNNEMSKGDFLSNLPWEIVENVLSYLDIQDFLNVQLVSKNWRNAVVGNGSFVQVVCERLDVASAEYATPEEAKGICRHILGMYSSSPSEWFTDEHDPSMQHYWTDIRACAVNDDGSRLCMSYDFESLWTLEMFTTTMDDVTPSYYDAEQTDLMSCIQYLDSNSIFCGYPTGKIERRNSGGRVITEYLGHSDEISAIDGNIDRDLLFSAADDKSIRCWRISTAERLSSIYFNGLVDELKFAPSLTRTDGDFILAVAVRLLFSPNQEELTSLQDFNKSIWILACSRDGRRMQRVCEVEEDQSLHWGFARGIFLTPYSFRYVQKRNADTYICDYLFDSGEIRRQKLFLPDGHVSTVAGIGKKYCLLRIVDNSAEIAAYWALMGKRGGVWKEFGKLPFAYLSAPNGSAALSPLDENDVKVEFLRCYLVKKTWLDAFRPQNMRGLAFVGLARHGVEQNHLDCAVFVFWK